jgi:hypothetical protein
MKAFEAVNIGKNQWKIVEGIKKDSRGVSRGVCNLWNP